MKFLRVLALFILSTGTYFGSSQVIAQSEFVQLDRGGSVICAARDDGQAVCSAPFFPNARVPVDFPLVEDIDAGLATVCAVIVGGDLQCFGSEAFGLLDAPTSGAPYKTVRLDVSHACAINRDNELECWGDDRQNRLDAPSGQFTQLSVSTQNACAVSVDGEVACWGVNDQGSLDVPDDLPAATKVVSSFASSCALLEDRSIECWGREVSPPNGEYVDFDILANGPAETGRSQLCALDDDGRADCVFLEHDGVGVSSRTDMSGPQESGIQQISVTFSFNGCYINSAGSIDCYGPRIPNDIPMLDGTGTGGGAANVTGLRAQIYSATTAELLWDRPAFSNDFAGHEIRRNGEIVAFTPNNASFIITGLAEGVTETFAVRTVTTQGLVGQFTDTISLTGIAGGGSVTPAYTPPDRLFETGTADAFVFCSDFAELLWFADVDVSEIDGYEIHRDNEFIAFVETDFFDDEGITPGVEHNYDIIAIDLEDPERFHGVASVVLDISEADDEFCI